MTDTCKGCGTVYVNVPELHMKDCVAEQLRLVCEERDRFKEACDRIMQIKVQDKPMWEAFREARQIAFGAF